MGIILEIKHYFTTYNSNSRVLWLFLSIILIDPREFAKHCQAISSLREGICHSMRLRISSPGIWFFSTKSPWGFWNSWASWALSLTQSLNPHRTSWWKAFFLWNFVPFHCDSLSMQLKNSPFSKWFCNSYQKRSQCSKIISVRGQNCFRTCAKTLQAVIVHRQRSCRKKWFQRFLENLAIRNDHHNANWMITYRSRERSSQEGKGHMLAKDHCK